MTSTTTNPQGRTAYIPTRETKVDVPPITAHQDVLNDEHLVRIELATHELRRLTTQTITEGGIADLILLARHYDQLRRDQQQNRHDPEVHDLIDATLTRVVARLTTAGAGTWHITPEHAEQLDIDLADAALEPDPCSDCGNVYALPGHPYCGPCDDAHTWPRGA